MYKQVEKPKENKSRAVANSVARKKSSVKQGFGFVDNRPEAIQMRRLRNLAKDSPQNAKLRDLHTLAAVKFVAEKKSKMSQNKQVTQKLSYTGVHGKPETVTTMAELERHGGFQTGGIEQQIKSMTSYILEKKKFLPKVVNSVIEDYEQPLNYEMVNEGPLWRWFTGGSDPLASQIVNALPTEKESDPRFKIVLTGKVKEADGYTDLVKDLKTDSNYNEDGSPSNFRNGHIDNTGIADWKIQADVKDGLGAGSKMRCHLNTKLTKRETEHLDTLTVDIVDITQGH